MTQSLRNPEDLSVGGELRPRLAVWLDERFRVVDRLFNRIYGSEWNPLYKSGSLAVAFLACTLITGIYLFIFYKVADPYGSVARLDATWLGSFMRSLHRYSADLAVVMVVVHAFKMLLDGRTWGPRALAWVSGLLLLGVVLLCGWTGLVMAWDVQGQLVALEGARLLDLLPVFSEPITRSFTHPGAVGEAFFFMNLFLHVALPLGLAGLFWLHSSRVARSSFFPPRPILRFALAVVAVTSLVVPVPLPPKADLLAVPVGVPLDVFYAFWLPAARSLSAQLHLLVWVAAAAVAFTVPWWWRPKDHSLEVSSVDEERCTGCSQCYFDCPYEAITMVYRQVPSTLSETVARIDPELCVACGICAGSCAPMGVGPPSRTGRDQLREIERLLAERPLTGEEIVLVACRHSLGDGLGGLDIQGVVPYLGGCSGSFHTSGIELLVRSGAAGVYLLTCPDRDCLYREGPKWLRERIYNEREAELQPRVDKRRVRIGGFAASELALVQEALRTFRTELADLGEVVPEHEVALGYECEVPDAYL